jgi:hypothetical protein
VVAVFALARSTGAAGLGIADAADALALAKPEIIDKTSSVNCPLAKTSVLLHFLMSHSFIIPLLLHTTILKHLFLRKYRTTESIQKELISDLNHFCKRDKARNCMIARG